MGKVADISWLHYYLRIGPPPPRGDAMNERSIRCTGEEVRAILAGQQKQLQRPIARAIPEGADEVFFWAPGVKTATTMPGLAPSGLWARRNDSEEGEDGWLRHLGACPFGQPGDRLWVRETWGDGSAFYPHSQVIYGADEPADLGASCREEAEVDRALGRDHRVLEGCRCRFRWRPSSTMPRWASRLTLEVLSVRVERLQDISEEDALAEGCATYRSTYGKRKGASRAVNPWVWVVSFTRPERG